MFNVELERKRIYSMRKRKIGLVPVVLGVALTSVGLSTTVGADELSSGVDSPAVSSSVGSSDVSSGVSNGSAQAGVPADSGSLVASSSSEGISEESDLNNQLTAIDNESNALNNDISNLDSSISTVNNELNSSSQSSSDEDAIQSELSAVNSQIDESQKASSERTALEESISSEKSDIASLESSIQEDESAVNNPEEITITKDPAGDAYREQQANIQSRGGEGRTALLGFSNSEPKVFNVNLTKEQADEYKRTGNIIYKPNLEKYADASVTIMKNIRLVNGIPLEVPPITAQANDYAQRRAEELSDTDFVYAHDSKRYPEETENNRGTENIGEISLGLNKGMSGFDEMPFSDEEFAYKNAYEYLAEYHNVNGAHFGHAYNLFDTTSIDGIGYGVVTKVKNGRLSIINTFDGYANTSGENLLSYEVYENQVKPVRDSLKEVKLSDGTVQLQYNGNPIKFVPHIIFKYHYKGEVDPEVFQRLEFERAKLAELKSKLASDESRVSSLGSVSSVSDLSAKRDALSKKLEDIRSGKLNADELSKKLSSLNSDKDSKSKKLAELSSKKAEILKRLSELKKVNDAKPALDSNSSGVSSPTQPTLTADGKGTDSSIDKLSKELSDVNSELDTKNSSVTALDNKISELNTAIQNKGSQAESEKKDIESKISDKSSELSSLKAELEEVQANPSTETKEVVRDLAGVSTQDRDYAHEQGKKITGKIYFADPQVEDVTIKITPEQGKQLLEHGYFEPTFDDREYAEKMGYWMNEIRKANGIDLKVPPVTEQAMAYAKSRTESMAQTGDFNHPKNPDSKYVYENISFDRITEREGIYKGANGFALSTDELAYVDSFEYMSEYSNIEEESDFGHARNELVLSAVNGIGASITAHKEGNKTLYYRSLNGTNLNSLEDYRHEYRSNVVPIQDRIREVRDSEGSKILTYNGVPIKFPRKRVYHYVWDEPVDNSSKVNELNSKIASVQGELDSLNSNLSQLGSSDVDALKDELGKATSERDAVAEGISALTAKRADLESRLASLRASMDSTNSIPNDVPSGSRQLGEPDNPVKSPASPSEGTPSVETPSDATPSVSTPSNGATKILVHKVHTTDTPKVETPSDATPSVEAPKVVIPDAPSVETPSIETPASPSLSTPSVAVPDTPKVETPSVAVPDAPKVETPSVAVPDAPAVSTTETSKGDALSVETPSVAVPDAPSVGTTETSKGDASKVDTSKVDTSKADTSKGNTSKADTSKVDAPSVDAPSVDAPKADTSKADTSNADTSKVDAPKADTSKVNVDKVETKKVDSPDSHRVSVPADTSKVETSDGTSKVVTSVDTARVDSHANSLNRVPNGSVVADRGSNVQSNGIEGSSVSNTSQGNSSNSLPNTGDSGNYVALGMVALAGGLALGYRAKRPY